MKVVLVGPFWYPRGSAASARLRNLAQGFRECGAEVHVVSMAPRPRAADDPPEDGVRTDEGVTYECVAPVAAAALGWRDPERTVPHLRRGMADRVRWFAGMYASTPAACRRLRELRRSGRCDLAFIYDRSAARLLPLGRTFRSLRVPTVLDVTEVSEHLSPLSPLYWDFTLGTRASRHLFDGHTLITTGLRDLYGTWGCGPRLVVPAVEAWPPREDLPPTGRKAFQLTYVGAMKPRDAPGLLFEALRLLEGRSPEVHLDIVGAYEGTPAGEAIQARCAADPSLSRRVRFLGTLGDEALRAHLRQSDGLVLTRRDARPEILSFPTRLVEFLSVGRPVFVSRVGDVPLYLRDGQDAVLLDPRSPERAAAAIAAVAERVDRGAALGREGRRAGARAFDRGVHAGRILDFARGLRPLEAAA